MARAIIARDAAAMSSGDDLNLSGDLTCENAQVRGELLVNGAPVGPGGGPWTETPADPTHPLDPLIATTTAGAIAAIGTPGAYQDWPLALRSVPFDGARTNSVLTAECSDPAVEGQLYLQASGPAHLQTFTTFATIAKLFSMTHGGSPILTVAGVYDDVVIDRGYVYAQPGGPITVNGIVPPVGAGSGIVVFFFNAGPSTVTFADQAPSSDTGARFQLPAATLVVPALKGCIFARFPNFTGVNGERWSVLASW